MMKDKMAVYERLLAISREAVTLESVNCLLAWDQETVMPRSGAAHRAEQLALTARLAHERLTSGEVGDCPAECDSALAGENPLSEISVNLRELRRRYDRRR